MTKKSSASAPTMTATTIATATTTTTAATVAVATTMMPSSPSTSTTITHRTNKIVVHNRRPQSMLSSARALMFDEPAIATTSYDRDLLKLSTSPKQQQQHHQQVNRINLRQIQNIRHHQLFFSLRMSFFPSQTVQPLTPPSFRKDHFLVNTSGGLSSSSGGLFKSASAVSVGRDFSGSVTPIQHQRKISYQNSHLFRSSGSGSSRTEISNLIRVRNSQLGKSAPSLSPSSVSQFLFSIFSHFLNT